MYLASSWRSHWKVDNSRRGCGCGPLQQVWCSNKIRTLERKKIIKQERGGDEEIKKSSSSALLSTDRLDPMFPKRGRRAREFKTDNRSSQTREREVVKSYFLSSFLVSVDDAKQRERQWDVMQPNEVWAPQDRDWWRGLRSWMISLDGNGRQNWNGSNNVKTNVRKYQREQTVFD